MKNIKIILSVMLALCFAGCQSGTGDIGGIPADNAETSGEQSSTEPTAAETDRTGEAEKVKLEPGRTVIQVEHHGRTVTGDVFIPEEESFPLVIFSHGYNGYKDDFRDSANYMMDNGIASVTFTFCGSGERDTSGFGTTNMTLFTEKEDLSALIDYAKQIEGFNGSLYLLGGSQGGIVSAMAAEERAADIKGMVLLFPAFNIPDNWTKTNYPICPYPTPQSIPESFYFLGVKLGRDFGVTMRDFYVFAKMADFQKPVLILHGTNDNIVPISCSQRAVNTYPNAELVTYKGEGHGFTSGTMRDAEEKLLEFINDNP